MMRAFLKLPLTLNTVQRRKIKTQFAAAAALLLLGVGNIIFGQVKYTEYLGILSKANAELTSPEKKRRLPILTPAVNVDKHAQYTEKLKSRIDFYRLVIQGGSCFCALGLILLLMGVIGIRAAEKSAELDE